MELGARDILLTALTVSAPLAETGVVLVRDSTATVVGTPLIVAGGPLFIVDAKDLLVKTDESARR